MRIRWRYMQSPGSTRLESILSASGQSRERTQSQNAFSRKENLLTGVQFPPASRWKPSSTAGLARRHASKRQETELATYSVKWKFLLFPGSPRDCSTWPETHGRSHVGCCNL